jgi:hypothetical protein
MKRLALTFALSFVTLSVMAGPKEEYQICMSKLEAAERHAERMKMEFTSACHYFYQTCSRRYWNGHPKPLIDDVTFIAPTTAHDRAAAVVVAIGNECMSLLDEMENLK